MTSTSPPAYPAEYYYPEFVNSRADDPRLLPPKPLPLSASVTAITSREQFTDQTKKPFTNNLASNVVTDQGLPDVGITEAARIDAKKCLIRDPAERNMPKLIINENTIQQAIHIPTMPTNNLDDIQTIETTHIPNGYTNDYFSNKTKPMESTRRPPHHQVVKMIEDKPPINDYWKKEILIDDEGVVAIEPIKYDRNSYEGPFGLTRKGSLIFYIGLSLFTLLAGVLLILTGVFYAENYPDSSSQTGELVGMSVCGFSFYIGLLLILIGIWHQKYRQENPIRTIKKKSTPLNNSTEHLKPSMEENEQYDYSYQQPPMDYAPPYGYYSNPSLFSTVNEQMLLQQPGAATGAGYYDPVIWPSNVQVETEPDPKFSQPMEQSLGLQQQTTADEPLLNTLDIRPSNKIRKSTRKTVNPVEAVRSHDEFDNLNMNSNVIEPPLPALSKAPETMELMQSVVQIEPTKNKSPTNGDLSPKKKNKIKSTDNQTDISSSNNLDKHHHHHRRHHHHHHHHHHHGHRHRPHHHHHDHSHFPSSQYAYHSHDFHHAHHPLPFPRVITPRHPKILIPNPRKNSATFYRETAINTGNETKIVRDSSTSVYLEDVSNTKNNRLKRIPIIRRTIIVEPYPAQPNSQIIVKPQRNLVGKISLSKNAILYGDDERLIYPLTTYLTKKSKEKKKKKSMVDNNNNIIGDLQLEDVNDDEQDLLSMKSKTRLVSTRTIVNNAFYN